MERIHDHENGIEDRNEAQQDVHQETPTAGNEVVERGSRRHHRRSEKGRNCICKPRRRRKRRRQILSNNPFIIFYLEMYFKDPSRRVTVVAREAGRKWCSMPEKSRQKYIRLAAKMKCRCSSKRR